MAQLYVRDKVGSVTRPVQQLLGFEKFELAAGEQRVVSFTLRPEDLAFTRADGTFGWEAGEFEVWISPHSGADASSSRTFSVYE